MWWTRLLLTTVSAWRILVVYVAEVSSIARWKRSSQSDCVEGAWNWERAYMVGILIGWPASRQETFQAFHTTSAVTWFSKRIILRRKNLDLISDLAREVSTLKNPLWYVKANIYRRWQCWYSSFPVIVLNVITTLLLRNYSSLPLIIPLPFTHHYHYSFLYLLLSKAGQTKYFTPH